MSDAPHALKSATATEVCYDVPRLLQLFESLGENCDLGVVQRAVGLEPFGLFRFSACQAPAVTELLRRRFDKLCEPDDLWLDVVGEEREYWVKSRNTPFEAHTNRYADRHEEPVVRRGELDRMRYLKTHLLQDLERGKKFFVFKGESDLATMQEMAAALQLYGPNRLLWIACATPSSCCSALSAASEPMTAHRACLSMSGSGCAQGPTACGGTMSRRSHPSRTFCPADSSGAPILARPPRSSRCPPRPRDWCSGTAFPCLRSHRYAAPMCR